MNVCAAFLSVLISFDVFSFRPMISLGLPHAGFGVFCCPKTASQRSVRLNVSFNDACTTMHNLLIMCRFKGPADKRRPPPGNSQRVHKTSLGLPNGSMTTSPLEDRDRVGHRGDDMPDIFQRLSSGVGSSAMRRGRSMDSLNGSLPNKDKKFGKNNLKN